MFTTHIISLQKRQRMDADGGLTVGIPDSVARCDLPRFKATAAEVVTE
jgi:hypothetical protein